ncbi:MAG: sulfur carrier protein ThiS [Thermoleophilia bacterium]
MLSFKNDGACHGIDCLQLVVQGRPLEYHGARDVRSLLESQGEKAAYANVRINGNVLNRRDFENIPIKEGDRIDFLYFMGGGSCLI